MNEILVSVCIVTYNHELYIKQCLESVLAQNVNFRYEIVIAEDCSTDNTKNIIKTIQSQHPNIFKVIYQAKNRGMMKNAEHALQLCRGKYIAILDGDDYWTDANKLHQQVNFLETQTNCVICFHNTQEIWENSNHKEPISLVPKGMPKITSFKDIIRSNYIPTCTIIFKNNLFHKLPGWTTDFPELDYSITLLNAQHGDIGYINKSMAVHRVHKGGMYFNLQDNASESRKHLLGIMQNIYQSSRNDLRPYVRNRISELSFELARIALKNHDFATCRKYLLQVIRWCLRNPLISKRELMRMLVKAFCRV